MMKPFDLFIMFLPVLYSLFPATLPIVHHLTYLSCFYLYIINYFLPHYKLYTIWPIYHVFTCTLFIIGVRFVMWQEIMNNNVQVKNMINRSNGVWFVMWQEIMNNNVQVKTWYYKLYTIWPIYHVFYLYVIIHYFLPHYKSHTIWPIYHVFTCTLLKNMINRSNGVRFVMWQEIMNNNVQVKNMINRSNGVQFVMWQEIMNKVQVKTW
jgi:hypothetical protein